MDYTKTYLMGAVNNLIDAVCRIDLVEEERIEEATRLINEATKLIGEPVLIQFTGKWHE